MAKTLLLSCTKKTKKTHQKKIIFDEVMNFPRSLFWGTLKNAYPRNLNIPTVCDVTWGTFAKIGHFCGAYLPRKIDLREEGITCRKILLDLF
jgi:hypothetical protein